MIIRTLQSSVLILWASLWTLLGLLLGFLAVVTRGGVNRSGRVLEFHGGVLVHLLRFVPIQSGASAMTLGHAIIGRSRADLDRCRQHELVHVRQYEQWGPFFVPAYLACSIFLWFRGGDPYRDNPFEREAFAIAVEPAVSKTPAAR